MYNNVIASLANWTQSLGPAVQTNPAPAQQAPTGPAGPCLFCNPVGLTDTEPPVTEWPNINVPASTAAENSRNFIEVLDSIKKFIDRLGQCPVSCALCERREIAVFVGSSGVGKSVAINLAAGHDPIFLPKATGGSLVEFSEAAPSKVYHTNASGTLFPFVYRDARRLIVDCPGFFENRSPGLEFLQRCVIKKMLESRDVKVVLFKGINNDHDVAFAELLNSELMVPGSCLVCFTKAENDTPDDWTAAVDESKRRDISRKFQNVPPLQTILLKRPKCYLAGGLQMRETFVRDLNVALDSLNSSRASVPAKASDALGMLANNATAAMLYVIRESLSGRLDNYFRSGKLQPYHIPFLKDLRAVKDKNPAEILERLRSIGFIALDLYETDCLVRYSHCWTLLAKSGLHVKGVSASDMISVESLAKIQKAIDAPEYEIRIDFGTALPEMLLEWVEICEHYWLEYVSYKGQILHLMERADLDGVVVGECNLLVKYRSMRCSSMESAFKVVSKKVRSELGSDGDDAAKMKEFLEPDRLRRCIDIGDEMIAERGKWDFRCTQHLHPGHQHA
ncbi:hypothetical protein HDU78_010156 [Chytriomyces hyalinus]|nr:hypothetical protein HDU78_010156 [Chytriomyces hyalinus]